MISDVHEISVVLVSRFALPGALLRVAAHHILGDDRAMTSSLLMTLVPVPTAENALPFGDLLSPP